MVVELVGLCGTVYSWLSIPILTVFGEILFDKSSGKRIGGNFGRSEDQTSADLIYHRLRGSASPVLTATGFVNGKGQFSTPHRIDTPQPITKKIVTGDYVGDPYGCAKLGAYPSRGASGHMGEI